MIDEVEAPSKSVVFRFVLSLPSIKKYLVEISAKVKSLPDMQFAIFVSSVIEMLTQTPTITQSFIISARAAVAGQGIAEIPVRSQSRLQIIGLLLRIVHLVCIEFVWICPVLVVGHF